MVSTKICVVPPVELLLCYFTVSDKKMTNYSSCERSLGLIEQKDDNFFL